MLRDAKITGYSVPELEALYDRDALGRLDRDRRVADIDPYSEVERHQIIEGYRRVRPHYHAFAVHQFWTGARPSESLALRRNQVDLKKRIIRLRGSRVLGQDSRAKTGKSVRDVLMHEPAFEALRACWPTHPAAEDLAFTTPTGSPIDVANFYRRGCVPMLRRLRIRARPFYNTRHTYLTYMRELAGTPLFAARQTGTSLEMIEKHDAAVRVLVDEIDERIAARHRTGNPAGTFTWTCSEPQGARNEKALEGQGPSKRAATGVEAATSSLGSEHGSGSAQDENGRKVARSLRDGLYFLD